MSNSTVPTSKIRVIALILAGGRGSRMGGKNKGLVQYQNKPLISHVIERIKPQVDDIVINCNADLESYTQFSYPITTDAPVSIQDLSPTPSHTIEGERFLGPLQGILSSYDVLKEIAGPEFTYVLICPCDTPRLPLNLVERLLQHVPTEDSNSITTVSFPAAITPCVNHRIEPLASLVSLTQIPSILNYLKENRRSVSKWLKAIDTKFVNFEDAAEGFMNLNRFEDLS